MFFPWRVALRRRVIVNLTDDRAIQGVLYAKRGPLLVVKNATLLERGSEPMTIDGDTIIERSKVLFIQAI